MAKNTSLVLATDEDYERSKHYEVGTVHRVSISRETGQSSSEEKEVQSEKEQQEPQAPAKQE